ncbi:unnamed protein product [Tuwongella immobilis]|uniref:Uncharacterized protein n=1 Tax=Tuwongella immobilis TaxID=692036 RepID=A0A6C2YXU9_9BACT|nr:unnamed protein product [Tuwongella immobilis]VTS08600.1 unnamed protein product [Tuwongella immobilis]
MELINSIQMDMSHLTSKIQFEITNSPIKATFENNSDDLRLQSLKCFFSSVSFDELLCKLTHADMYNKIERKLPTNEVGSTQSATSPKSAEKSPKRGVSQRQIPASKPQTWPPRRAFIGVSGLTESTDRPDKCSSRDGDCQGASKSLGRGPGAEPLQPPRTATHRSGIRTIRGVGRRRNRPWGWVGLGGRGDRCGDRVRGLGRWWRRFRRGWWVGIWVRRPFRRIRR